MLKVKISLFVIFILSGYSENKRRVYGENGKFRAVCDTQNRLRIRGKNLCVHGEDAKKHKTEDIAVNNGQIFLILYFYTVGWIKPFPLPFQKLLFHANIVSLQSQSNFVF
jgi:hypothetical protein